MNISLDASPTTGKDLPSMMTPQKGSIVRQSLPEISQRTRNYNESITVPNPRTEDSPRSHSHVSMVAGSARKMNQSYNCPLSSIEKPSPKMRPRGFTQSVNLSPKEFAMQQAGLHDASGIEGYLMVKPIVPNLDKLHSFVSKDHSANSFINQVIKRSQKLKGPSDYKPVDLGSFTTNSKSIRLAIAKAHKKSVFEQQSKAKAFIPGSGAYKPKPVEKPIGCPKQTSPLSGFMNHAIAESSMVPAPYKAVDFKHFKEKVPHTNFASSKSPRLPPLVVPVSPTSAAYNVKDHIDSTKEKHRSCQFSKGARISEPQRLANKGKSMPSPGQYDIHKADKVATLGARKGYK